MPNRFLIIVTIATVLFTIGVVCFAFKDTQSGGQAFASLKSTAAQCWLKVKDFASPITNTFGLDGTDEVTRHLEDAAQAVDSAVKSITR